jgi:hypothetical protein
MYLDPGSTGLFIQALFALLATVVTLFARSRQWVAGLWARVTRAIKPRRPPQA